MKKAELLEGLYVITDETLSPGRTHAQIAKAALEGGARIIQLRDKTCSDRHFYAAALEIRKLTRSFGALFIINDRIHIALAAEADGVNCGQTDLPCPVIRKLLGPEAVIGISCSSAEEAAAAEKDGADYIGLGAVFPTRTKADSPEAGGLDLITETKKRVSLPIAARAGINQSNIRLVGERQSEMACVVSAVVCAGDMEKAAAELKEAFENAKRQ
ncbi:MAG: thiamine phosphate synthase [Abditibacteriota bacterium]|nr:thiamine phosphate synthase [Abditibacteriota bacterium]